MLWIKGRFNVFDAIKFILFISLLQLIIYFLMTFLFLMKAGVALIISRIIIILWFNHKKVFLTFFQKISLIESMV
ncbi:hypothetical protein HLVA_17840 [Haliovirga abyssi]|uniref:Uncharacterized protein n=1 Tax=Haliovirga abyssi TaxID=2996794 RepID=A0AAU9E026_9FUSO|nr:hypothetical protein HLVA_17840 [Haliovirga abyssi]